MVVNSGKTYAQIVGGSANILPVPSSAQTLIHKTYRACSNAQALHTVTAGKTFYCTAVIYGAAASGSGAYAIKNNTDTVFYASASIPNLGGICISNGTVLFTVAAAKDLILEYNGTAGNAYVTLVGFEA